MILKKFFFTLICCFALQHSINSMQRFSQRPITTNIATTTGSKAAQLFSIKQTYVPELPIYTPYSQNISNSTKQDFIPESQFALQTPLKPLQIEPPFNQQRAQQLFTDASMGKTMQWDNSRESRAARQALEETEPQYYQAKLEYEQKLKDGTLNDDTEDQKRIDLYKNRLQSLVKHGIINQEDSERLLSYFQEAMSDLTQRRKSQQFSTNKAQSSDFQKAASALGVNENASQAEIQAAFKAKAKLVHPDMPGGSNAAMREALNARDILLGKRTTYQKQEQPEDKGPKKPFFTRTKIAAAGSLGTALTIGPEIIDQRNLAAEQLKTTEKQNLIDRKQYRRPENMNSERLSNEKNILSSRYSPYTRDYTKNRLAEINAELAKRYEVENTARTAARNDVHEQWSYRE